MSIIDKVKKLNLPSGQYIVYGSGILEALGFRESRDVDISVTKKLHQLLRESGEWREEIRYGKIFLKKNGIEINSQLDWDEYQTTTAEAIKTAKNVNGIPFLNIFETIKFKKALGRKKDLSDIKLLEQYLTKNENLRDA
ncbi:hypothetical protein A2215_02485 [Candidatus Berkelbacteria bacterium RIFOXYA2_FULL_43_10]|uniref:Uncharacterized protein n=1 Tax=Candidatus Berkelbacteria bacterium RIFOXYA2_FULL_43_10 TaxID=1797472 RepID=A0A1F5ECU4_9BACT|nr:MAG: hypothetical protein A2215_02485 [Candidatus Berkelbacteria bacterium RIFOXYA2_FULL_43_10]